MKFEVKNLGSRDAMMSTTGKIGGALAKKAASVSAKASSSGGSSGGSGGSSGGSGGSSSSSMPGSVTTIGRKSNLTSIGKNYGSDAKLVNGGMLSIGNGLSAAVQKVSSAWNTLWHPAPKVPETRTIYADAYDPRYGLVTIIKEQTGTCAPVVVGARTRDGYPIYLPSLNVK